MRQKTKLPLDQLQHISAKLLIKVQERNEKQERQ